MINSIKEYLIVIIVIIVAYFSIEWHKTYIKNRQLELDNKKMQQTQEIQDNVIVITDENQINNQLLENKVNDKIKLVKNVKVKVLSEKEFIIKSNNVFKNFGNEN